MKKLILKTMVVMMAFTLQNCSSDDDGDHNEADGHIKVTATLHDEVADEHNPVQGATISMWFNKSGADGTADYTGTTDATGFVEFEELLGGIYFIKGSVLDDENVERTGTFLAEVSEANHELDIELELE
jgi:hypothetical protein